MVSDAQKKASAKWDKENMIVVGTKLKRTYAADFRVACESVGTTPSAVIKKAIDDFMNAQTQQEPPHAAGDASQTDSARSEFDSVSDEMKGAMDALKAAAVAQIADASHEMRNTSAVQDDETEVRRAAVLAKIKEL